MKLFTQVLAIGLPKNILLLLKQHLWPAEIPQFAVLMVIVVVVAVILHILASTPLIGVFFCLSASLVFLVAIERLEIVIYSVIILLRDLFLGT